MELNIERVEGYGPSMDDGGFEYVKVTVSGPSAKGGAAPLRDQKQEYYVKVKSSLDPDSVIRAVQEEVGRRFRYDDRLTGLNNALVNRKIEV